MPKLKGKGKPHLKPVEDTMAQANNLAAAMIVAPIAGIAAAVGKFYKRTKCFCLSASTVLYLKNSGQPSDNRV
jgi:hypothetical protein